MVAICYGKARIAAAQKMKRADRMLLLADGYAILSDIHDAEDAFQA